ncbi:MAG: hypothetical protein LBJ62_00545 [Bifidobacteriaceae bacterium]|jgi:alternate signal-mediated exported protein|nr:hypothetical protein [Bifidobacteriaceae bacterium]
MKENTSRVSRRTKGVIAAVTGVALLMGGSTFALWTAGDTFDSAGNISTGTLEVAKGSADVAFYDVSADRGNADGGATNTAIGVDGHIMDADGLIVPGDTIAVLYPAFEVTMKGDNLVGEMKLSLAGVMNTIEISKVQYKVKIGGGAWSSLTEWSTLTAPVSLGYVSNEEDSGVDEVKALGGETGEVTVALFVTFNEAATGDMLEDQALQNLSLAVTQVRTDQVGNYAV